MMNNKTTGNKFFVASMHRTNFRTLSRIFLFCFFADSIPAYAQEKIASNASQIVLNEALALQEKGECNSAISLFSRAYQQFETQGDEQAMTTSADGWATCLLSSGKVDSALAVYQKVIQHGKKAADFERVMFAYSVISEIARMRGNPQLSLENNLKCAHYCQLIKDQKTYSSRLSIIGSNYLELGQIDSAYSYIKKGLQLKESIRDTALLCIAYDHLGNYYRSTGELGKSAEAFLNALKAAEIAKNDSQIGSSLMAIGSVLIKDNHPEKAREYVERARVMFDTLGYPIYYANTLNLLGRIESEEGREDLALQHYHQALDVFLKKSSRLRVHGQYLLLAKAYKNIGDYSQAWNFSASALQTALELKDETRKAETLLLQGQILVLQQEGLRAEALFKEALSIGSKLKSPAFQVESLQGLMQIEEQRGNYKEALHLLRESQAWEDTIEARKESEFLQQLEAKYKRREQDAAISHLNFEKELMDFRLENSKDIQKLLVVGGILALIVAALGFFLFYQKKKNAALLVEKNKTIEKALADKELLLREIHHRVKNNLQVVSSLLSLQSKYITDPTAISAVNNSRSRVRSMALIHQNLYQSDNLMGVEVQTYFTKLLAELFDTYRVDQDLVALRMDIEPMKLDVDAIVPMGLIINELVSNSLKYAFKPAEKGWVSVMLKKTDQGVFLEAADSGSGFSPDAFENSSTFGFRLVKAFVAKLEADIKISGDESGTKIQIHIPQNQLNASV
jgi:two-component sensor histidine kinase